MTVYEQKLLYTIIVVLLRSQLGLKNEMMKKT